MKIFPTEYQFLYRRNASRLHSLWLALYLGVYVFFLVLVWRILICHLVAIAYDFVTTVLFAVVDWAEMVWKGLTGRLDAEDMTEDEFLRKHLC